MREKKKSLVATVLCLLVVLTVVPVTISAVYLTTSTAAELEKTAGQTADYATNQFTDRAESVLSALRGDIFILTTDPKTQTAMRQAAEGMPLDSTEVEASLVRVFTSTGREQSCLTGIFLMQSEDKLLPILRTGLYSAAALRARLVYAEHSGVNSAKKLLTIPACPGYCYMVTDYNDMTTMEPLGKIIFEIDVEAFASDAYIESIYPGAHLLLSDLEGNHLYGDEALHSEWTAAKQPQDRAFIHIGDADYYHSGNRMDGYNLRVDVFIPTSDILGTIDEIVRLYVVVTLVILGIALAAGVLAFTALAKPLQKMVVAIDQVSGGDLNTRMSPTPYRETEHIRDAFNDMTQNLVLLFDEVYKGGLLLREAEYKTLEAQINPHFIFNVLETINMRAMAGGQDDICRMVSNLANLLRSSLTERKRQKITFGKELEYVYFYLELQKERFGEGLHYEIHIEDEALRDYYLPKLTLQPVVENSVVHGLENKRGGGSVQVHIWEEDTGMMIRVTDDGVGFDASSLDLNRPYDEAEGEKHNHVALYNINRRIQLLYGSSHGLSIRSIPGEGSEILIRLPLDREGGEGIVAGIDRGQ